MVINFLRLIHTEIIIKKFTLANPERERGSVPQAAGSGTPFTRDDKQGKGTIPMPTCARRPLTMSSIILEELPQTSMVGPQRQQISELQFEKFLTPRSFLVWRIRFKNQATACSDFHRMLCCGSKRWRWWPGGWSSQGMPSTGGGGLRGRIPMMDTRKMLFLLPPQLLFNHLKYSEFVRIRTRESIFLTAAFYVLPGIREGLRIFLRNPPGKENTSTSNGLPRTTTSSASRKFMGRMSFSRLFSFLLQDSDYMARLFRKMRTQVDQLHASIKDLLPDDALVTHVVTCPGSRSRREHTVRMPKPGDRQRPLSNLN